MFLMAIHDPDGFRVCLGQPPGTAHATPAKG